jgi:hypothetical protein
MGCDSLTPAAHADLKRIILAIFPFDRQFGQIVLVQEFRQSLDKGHIRFMGFVRHIFLDHSAMMSRLAGSWHLFWPLIGQGAG